MLVSHNKSSVKIERKKKLCNPFFKLLNLFLSFAYTFDYSFIIILTAYLWSNKTMTLFSSIPVGNIKNVFGGILTVITDSSMLFTICPFSDSSSLLFFFLLTVYYEFRKFWYWCVTGSYLLSYKIMKKLSSRQLLFLTTGLWLHLWSWINF